MDTGGLPFGRHAARRSRPARLADIAGAMGPEAARGGLTGHLARFAHVQATVVGDLVSRSLRAFDLPVRRGPGGLLGGTGCSRGRPRFCCVPSSPRASGALELGQRSLSAAAVASPHRAVPESDACDPLGVGIPPSGRKLSSRVLLGRRVTGLGGCVAPGRCLGGTGQSAALLNQSLDIFWASASPPSAALRYQTSASRRETASPRC